VKNPIKVAVTGASGNVAYGFLFRALSGEVFGADQPIRLQLHDLDSMLGKLEGVVYELEDCASPLLAGVDTTSDATRVFDGVSWALLLGSVPRGPGMERGDLIRTNAGIFNVQGAAINKGAADDVRIIVVGNPCNTNCMIARTHAPDVPEERWFAMVMLDRNRARAYLAARAGVPTSQIKNLVIWGNHSATQYPDSRNTVVAGRPGSAVFDEEWLRGEFIGKVQKRGAAIIAARGASSAGSAANAVVDNIHEVSRPTPAGDCIAAGFVSRGEYGVPVGLQFGFPLRFDGTKYSVIEGFEHSDAARQALQRTTQELLEERDLVRHLLGPGGAASS
jgi:malate dehydrogenase